MHNRRKTLLLRAARSDDDRDLRGICFASAEMRLSLSDRFPSLPGLPTIVTVNGRIGLCWEATRAPGVRNTVGLHTVFTPLPVGLGQPNRIRSKRKIPGARGQSPRQVFDNWMWRQRVSGLLGSEELGGTSSKQITLQLWKPVVLPQQPFKEFV